MASTSLMQPTQNVEFQDVTYCVTERKNYVKVTGTREILGKVSGVFKNGELSAIMGPSGSGKSSLLNAISGYRTSGVKGHIKINRKNSCYITQEERHQPLLSVNELMNLSYDLKVKNLSKKEQSITEILQHLNLNGARNVTADKLSGGERKRLSIALELVANPAIFFLDEPTSGLDEVTAAQCIRLLRHLAKEGRTIVCTIHQPSATIFNCFDKIFVLAQGQCVYQGGPLAIIPFLKQMDLSCPTHYSPSDYIIELCDSNKTVVRTLAEMMENGKLMCVTDDKATPPGVIMQNALTEGFPDHQKERVRSFSRRNSSINGGGIVETMKAFSRLLSTEHEKVSPFYQFVVLLKVMLLKISRSRIALVIQLGHHIMSGLCFGLIFYNSANEAERMFDHLKFCVGCILVIVYTQVMVPVLSYSMEVKLVKKECFNRWYSLTPYYMALTISRIPLQTALNIIFLSLTYWMAGLPSEWWRFGLFSLVGIVTSFVAEGMGLAIGATFSITNGSAVGPLLIAPFMGLAIYGFDFAKEISVYTYAIMKLSYIRVGSEAILLTVFGFDREELECNDMYCHFGDPKVLLRFLDFENASLWREFFYLTLLLIFYRLLLFLSLKIRCGT